MVAMRLWVWPLGAALVLVACGGRGGVSKVDGAAGKDATGHAGASAGGGAGGSDASAASGSTGTAGDVDAGGDAPSADGDAAEAAVVFSCVDGGGGSCN